MKAKAAALSPLFKRRGLLAAFGVALMHVQQKLDSSFAGHV